MESNIIRAIINLVENPVVQLKEYASSRNRANSMGGALEEYIKDIFAGTTDETNEAARMVLLSQCFSYLGNQNNPPDSIIKNGDAIEVKKIESSGSSLALNSSYPKAKLFSSSNMLTDECKKCETWTEKDIIYTVGVVNKKNVLSELCMVYGIDYAASENIYTRIKNAISDGVNSIQGIEFAETKELGRVNRVDPLGITYMRIRGMWGIENPMKVFDYVYKKDASKTFNFMAIINNEKYNSLKYTDELENLAATNPDLLITDIQIKTPDNPAALKAAKLITFKI